MLAEVLHQDVRTGCRAIELRRDGFRGIEYDLVSRCLRSARVGYILSYSLTSQDASVCIIEAATGQVLYIGAKVCHKMPGESIGPIIKTRYPCCAYM